MASRNLLHRNKLDDFKQWLIENKCEVKPPKGAYEVLRWKGVAGKPMPIVFDRHEGDHLSLNESAAFYVRRWLRERAITGG